MTQYLISFGAHAMDHVPDEDMPAVAGAARAAVREAINAGVYVSAGGLGNQPASIVAADGAVTDGPSPDAIGGFTLVDVPSREEALRWATKLAVACRCAQEVREVGADPELDAMLRQADSRRLRPGCACTYRPQGSLAASRSGWRKHLLIFTATRTQPAKSLRRL
jgi:hypothetical protein